MPPKKKSHAQGKRSSVERSKKETVDTPSGSSTQQETGQEENLFESEPSKEFSSSTLRYSPSKTYLELSPNRKRSFRKISIDNSPLIPLNDDSHELIEHEDDTVVEPEALAKPPEPEQEMSIVQTMTLEQMQEHVSRCLQLSTENKINSKNAFALKLIDCMTIMTKNDEESNFAAMACQLDAGAKIYSHRVDAVHQQVIKLVDSCLFAEKRANKKEGESEHEDQSEDDDANTDGKVFRDKKKKLKKKVIASSEQITRKPKEKDPREKFVRLEALPGDILEKARREPSSLALSLDSASPFWPAQRSSNFSPRVRGPAKMLIPRIVLKDCMLGPVLKKKNDVKPSTKPPENSHIADLDSCDASIVFGSDFSDDEKEEPETVNQCKEAHPETEVVAVARNRMTMEGSMNPSRLDVMKTLFHQPGESDYHYLKMDNSHYWAGPSYWKRPHGVNVAANKKKVVRKKKEPVAIEYTGAVSKETKKGKGKSREKVVRATKLSRRVLTKWSKKKVTLPNDIHFEPQTFDKLFHLDIMAQTVLHEPENNPPDSDEDDGIDAGYEIETNTGDSVSTDVDTDTGAESGIANDATQHSQEPGCMEASGTSDNNEPSGAPADPVPTTNTQIEEAGPSTSASNPGSCDVYEGDNLVPMVKVVKVEPIRYVARPNRVDMGHLKEVMLTVIRRKIEDTENEQRQAGSQTPHGNVMFKDVLSELYSSDLLQSRTHEDLSVQMSFLCLLTLANENNFALQQDGDDGGLSNCGDISISYDPLPSRVHNET